MANFCRNCGKEINMDSGFCPNCGTKVGENTNVNNVSETTKKDNTVAAFVLSLLGFLCCTYLAIPGLIMSIMSLKSMNHNEISTKNKGLAIAGTVLGVLGIIIMINNSVNPDPATTEMIEEWLS